MLIFDELLETLIKLLQNTPLRGTGGYSCEALAMQGVRSQFPQAEREAEQFKDFLDHFDMPGIMQWFRDKAVLDLGCGYGGKTVEFARTCLAREVYGIEPVENHIELSRLYAISRGAHNCHFKVCSQHAIPFEEESFDAVVSHDVLEHVTNPRVTIKEIYRVLKPGGKAFIVFPPYHGIMAHHLDYIVRVPALHLIFSPDAIIKAVNRVLNSPGGDKFGTKVQPVPAFSFNGKRKCLPTLNGLTSKEFLEIIKDFKIEELQQKPLFSRYKKVMLGKPLFWLVKGLRALGDLPRDIFSWNLVCILGK